MKRLWGMLVLVGLAPLGAQDAPAKPPAEEYQDRLARIQKNQAEEHYKLGEFLTMEKMHRWAREEYNKVLKFNGEHEGARGRLGYRRSEDGSWEIDPDKTPEVDNKKNGQEEVLKIRLKYEEKNLAAGKTISRQWLDLGNFCEKNQMASEAGAAWKTAIEYDPQNEGPRKKLKYVRDGKDGPWLSPFESKIRKEMKDGLKNAPGGQPDSATTKVETDMQLKHQKRKSAHFLIESAPMTQDQLKAETQHAEHAYAMFHKLFGQEKDLFQQPFNLVIVKDKSMHERYIDIYHKGPQVKKDFAKKASGQMGFPQAEMTLGEHPHCHDWVVHVVVQNLSNHVAGGERHWLHEGLAYHFTKTMLATTATYCVDLAGTGAGSDGKRYDDPDDWPLIIRTWIKEAKDPNIHEVVKCHNLAELNGAEAVKAWSLIDFLITEHREKFIDFMTKLRGQKEEEDEKTLREVFGWNYDEMDARWRVYARSSY